MGIFNSSKENNPEGSSQNKKQETPNKPQKSSDRQWQVGDRILDRYEILDIKMGGMGIVYIASDKDNKPTLAVKTYQNKFISNKNAIDRFIAEAETWIKIGEHPNIVCAIMVLKIDGKPYIFMEYIDGGDLSDYIGKLDIAHFLLYATQFCNGMDYAYKKLKVIHRDIKPQNILISKNMRLKITDFGLAKAVAQNTMDGEMDSSNQMVSRGMGTWQYMPPEQFPEEIQRQFHFPIREVTTRSDIYSFGVTFYQLYTGRLPFQTIEQIFKRNPFSPQDLKLNLHNRLYFLLVKCLEKNPEDRYKDFEELHGELCSILPGLDNINKELLKSQGPSLQTDWALRGLSLDEIGKHSEAIESFDKAIEAEPRNYEVWIAKGISLEKSGAHQEALSCYNHALEIEPKSKGAWQIRGILLHEQGKFQEALKSFEKVIELDPNDTDAWFNKGSILDILMKYPEAINCYEKVLKIDPKYAKAWFHKGRCLIYLDKLTFDQLNESLTCFKEFIRLDPADLDLLNQAKVGIKKIEEIQRRAH